MLLPHATAIVILVALSGCGSEPAPKAAPGAVERTTEALDRDEAAEQAATIDSNPERIINTPREGAARRTGSRRWELSPAGAALAATGVRGNHSVLTVRF